MGASALASLALLPSASSATLLYVVTDIAKFVTTLNLTTSTSGQPSLEPVAFSAGCGPYPTWLSLNKATSTLHCLYYDSYHPKNGSLLSLRTSPDGVLTPLSNISIPAGYSSGVLYGSKASGIAVANSQEGSVRAYSISGSALSEIYAEHFDHVQQPGQVDSQGASHPAAAVLDPTGTFLLVPDYGADLVRVWNVDQKTLALTASTPLTAAIGSGSCRLVFLKTASRTLMYLISEIANTITVYDTTYKCDGSLGFEQVYMTDTHGLNTTLPLDTDTFVWDVQSSPDIRYILVLSVSMAPESPGKRLNTFSVDAETGALAHVQTVMVGYPYSFSISKDGTFVAFALWDVGTVAVYARDVATGLLTRTDASFTMPGGERITYVVFDE
ncbi:putative isomerase YbhE [Coniochaeta ligniaria NRRL 30616]|uniref:Putative isomerase YbhE n=1 Tax=Coniochaeta ligniaria NRRL 30616 TaxID=1408157 RepID=A0A1J7IX38_9PEZI|nr:putative isomerase YbhE [Coniochaeta ligniaria NRRL 30616]